MMKATNLKLEARSLQLLIQALHHLLQVRVVLLQFSRAAAAGLLLADRLQFTNDVSTNEAIMC